MYGTQWECCGPLYAKKVVHSGNWVCTNSEYHGRSAEQHPESTGSERPGPEVLKWCCSVNSRTYSKTLKYSMVPVNNSKPSFSSSVFICTTILVHAWPLFLNLRDLQRSRNSVKNSALEASSAEFSDRFPGFADSRPDFQTCFWFWDSGLSRNFMLFCGP